MKGFEMKKVYVIAALFAVLFLTGCQNSELVNCQEENKALQSNVSLLQQDLDKAKTSLENKDKTIEDLQSENVKIQTQAMESIKTMMEKQTAKDKEVRDKLASTQKEATEYKIQLEQTKAQLSLVEAERDKALQQLKEVQAPAEQPVQAQ